MTLLRLTCDSTSHAPLDRQTGSASRHRILMVAACPFPAARGTPARILRMAETLANRGHDVHVVAYHLGETFGEFPFNLHRIARVPTYRKMEPGPSLQKLVVLDAMLAWKIASLTRRLQPDVIHAHHFEGLLSSLPAKILHSIPVVFDAHVLLEGELEYYRTGMPPSLRTRISRLFDRRLPALASHVVAVSDEIRNILVAEHGYPAERVSVAANGVESVFFDGDAAKCLKKDRRRLVFTGNLAAYQGTESMLRALSIVLRQHDDVCLTVVTASDPGEFRRMASDLGVESAIEVIDCELQDIPDVIASADVALNPRTRCPGIPQKLLNYMAGAAPIVSFNGSAKYLHDEVSALIIDDGDVDGFAKAILRLLDDRALAHRLGKAAQSFARENLSWDINSRIIEGVYAQLSRSSCRQTS